MKKNLLTILLLLVMSASLSGCLESIFGGAAATTMSFAKDRPAGDTLTDIRISTRIKGELIKGHFKKIYSRITVEVVQGRVLLAGLVEEEQHMLKAIEIAWNQQGVTEVINEIKVDPNSGHFSLVQYTKDTMITSQTKSKMLMDRSIKAVNITVITINDIVYLFGIARSEEELEKVANIAANINGVKKVISHIQVKSQARKVKNSDFSNHLIDKDLMSEHEIDKIFDPVEGAPKSSKSQLNTNNDELNSDTELQLDKIDW